MDIGFLLHVQKWNLLTSTQMNDRVEYNKCVKFVIIILRKQAVGKCALKNLIM